MNNLNFQTSRKTYTVNGGEEITFDPADVGFTGRIYDLLDKLQKLEQMPEPDMEDVFRVAAERDRTFREEIDKAFGEPVCNKVFGATNIFSPAGGAPLCLNFLLAVIDEIDAASENELKESPQLKAYMQKYQAKYGNRVRK